MINKIKSHFANFFNWTNEEKEMAEIAAKEELINEKRKKVRFYKEAATDEAAENIFNIAFYCHHSLPKDEEHLLEQEWREYYKNAKATGELILPYYYYILERIEFRLKDKRTNPPDSME